MPPTNINRRADIMTVNSKVIMMIITMTNIMTKVHLLLDSNNNMVQARMGE